jgi:hypothetical protein
MPVIVPCCVANAVVLRVRLWIPLEAPYAGEPRPGRFVVSGEQSEKHGVDNEQPDRYRAKGHAYCRDRLLL